MSKVTVKFGENSDRLYVDGVYLTFNEDGQGEFVIPEIEVYPIKDGVREYIGGKTHLYCPNTKVLGHTKNQWSRVEGTDHIIVCSECGCRMDISNINGVAKLEENQ